MVPHSAIHQRGAIGLMAALTLGLALLFMLLVVDSGRLYLEQRKLQRIADMAALEAVSGNGNCVGASPSAIDLARKAAVRNGHADSTEHTLIIECGNIKAGASGLRAFVVDANQDQAIRVTVSHRVPSSIVAGAWNLVASGTSSARTRLQAQATAGRVGPALARLAIRTSLAEVDTAKSALLNSTLGALLNSQLSLSAAQWNGLLNADLNLLHFLDALTLTAGTYTELLQSTVALSDVFTAMAQVAAQDNPLIDVSGLVAISTATKDAGGIVLGELINIQNGNTSSGLNATLKAFELVQGTIELANSKHAVETTLPVNVLGLGGISTRLKIIDPPQISVVGDPSLAQTEPSAPGQIYVKTAQTRILLRADLSTLLLDLNLLPNLVLDIGLELASANSHVQEHDCSSALTKRLGVKNESAAAHILVGRIDMAKFFDSHQPPTVSPLVILKLPLLLEVTLKTDSKIISNTEFYNYAKPPNLDQLPMTHVMSTKNIVTGLGNALRHVELTPNVVGLNLVISGISTLLGALLDPLINNLLDLLGVDLNSARIDANLSCQSGRPQLLL
ncbi:pilus assembly protein TadG-related protein [Pseudomonas sp. p1(2021b)]|uniref:pilus assembly protein TadG-related protein n=1 Tax=Pseudomonas sp. p1(2021b) TaxID=2874628 RepID=UPI001CCD17FE|nr:pilus assembly protein TadG-related protein [Pseudomonas sp. p1(2021b)]UBM24761.1 pilus assembly protein TadG-related protein [Pseudomonas sp. p1(2021b)]